MKHNQKKTKSKRVKRMETVHGNPMFGMRNYQVAVGFYTPKELHEHKMPLYTKLNKRV